MAEHAFTILGNKYIAYNNWDGPMMSFCIIISQVYLFVVMRVCIFRAVIDFIIRKIGFQFGLLGLQNNRKSSLMFAL